MMAGPFNILFTSNEIHESMVLFLFLFEYISFSKFVIWFLLEVSMIYTFNYFFFSVLTLRTQAQAFKTRNYSNTNCLLP